MIYSYAPFGYQGVIVEVESEIRKGIPGVDIVGMAGTAVREAAARIRAACRSSSLSFPKGRILINLAPADFPKQGSGFDLAIAVSVLFPELKNTLIIGELSLDGTVKAVPGIEAALWYAREKGISNALIPYNVEVLKVPGLKIQTIASLDQLKSPTDYSPSIHSADKNKKEFIPDFNTILGHKELKNMMGVAAIGRHHVLLSGPPGCGKTMAAHSYPSLLAGLNESQKIEVRRIHSLSSEQHYGDQPPIRYPHHTSSLEGLIGGGKTLIPGEISLAHHGVLLLDELGEFKGNVIQALRQPLEQKQIHVTRTGYKSYLPADFQLFATMNACMCGMLGKSNSNCLCSIFDLKKYWKKIGAPLLDRIDLRIPLVSGSTDKTQSTQFLKEKVLEGMSRQAYRANGESWDYNRDIPTVKLYGYFNKVAGIESLLNRLHEKLRFSTRGVSGALRTALSIADFENRPPCLEDLARAIQFRRIGEAGQYWPEKWVTS